MTKKKAFRDFLRVDLTDKFDCLLIVRRLLG